MKLYFFSIFLFVNFYACNEGSESEQSDAASTNNANTQSSQQTEVPGGGSQAQRSGTNKNPLVDEFIGLIAEISERAPSLARIRDVSGKLRNTLKANIGYACMLDIPVSQIEIKIEGSDAGEQDLDSCDTLTGIDSSNANYRFTFKNSLGSKSLIFNNDEISNKLFGTDNSKIFVSNIDTFKVFDFESISIEKINSNITKSGDTCTEIQRTNLNGVQVKVNNFLVYNNSAISHTFQKENYTWIDESVQINPSFINLKRIDDCTSYQ